MRAGHSQGSLPSSWGSLRLGATEGRAGGGEGAALGPSPPLSRGSQGGGGWVSTALTPPLIWQVSWEASAPTGHRLVAGSRPPCPRAPRGQDISTCPQRQRGRVTPPSSQISDRNTRRGRSGQGPHAFQGSLGKENSSHFSGWGRVERGGGETFTAQDRGSGGSARAPSCEAGPTEEGDITGPSSGPGQILELLRACFPTSLPPLRQARRALPLEGKDILSRPGPLPTKGDTATPQAAVAAASPGINICGVMERLGPGGAGAAPSFPLTTTSEPPLSTLVPSWHNSHGGGYYGPGTSLLPARTWGDPAWTRRDPAGSLHRPGGWVPSPAPDSTRPALTAQDWGDSRGAAGAQGDRGPAFPQPQSTPSLLSQPPSPVDSLLLLPLAGLTHVLPPARQSRTTPGC